MQSSIVAFNYNSWYGHPGSFVQNTSGNYTFANWQSATFGNQDANGSNGVNPLFVDAANNNFRLQAGSPARTLGRTIQQIHGSSGQTIPAGAYITGQEVIGITSNGNSTSSGGAVSQEPTSVSAPVGLVIIR